MSNFYGTVIGAAETVATRRGFYDIKTAAQSYDGSIITRLYYDRNNGELCVDLEHSEYSATYGNYIFRGTVKELIAKLEK